MATFHLQIVTPDRLFFDGEAERLVVRTSEGDIGILPGHTPLVTPLGIGPMRVFMPDGQVRFAAIANGFLKASPQQTTLVAVTCEWAEEIDVDRARRAKEDAEEKLRAAQSQREHDLAELRLKKAINRLQISKD